MTNKYFVGDKQSKNNIIVDFQLNLTQNIFDCIPKYIFKGYHPSQWLIAQLVERVTTDPRVRISNPEKVYHKELEIIQPCD